MKEAVVEVEGRRLKLTNLDKALYPDGFTKGQVIDYYTRVAPVLLPHLRDRSLTRLRCPDGVDGETFFEKNTPRGTPEWVRTERIGGVTYPVVEGLADLVWLANLAALELHTHQWRVGSAVPDQLVLDLDPGPPASVVECCRVALLVREHLVAVGLEPVVKTSGSKGLQVYAKVEAEDALTDTSAFARVLAEELEKAHPDLVVSRMTRAVRPGKVFLDWSQNNGAKTTVAPYSLRARPRPTASTPVTWDEVAGCSRAEDLVFTSDDVLRRVDEHGDLLAPLL